MLSPCCENGLEMCNFNNSDNICKINNEQTFIDNYKICCANYGSKKPGHGEICKKISKKIKDKKSK